MGHAHLLPALAGAAGHGVAPATKVGRRLKPLLALAGWLAFTAPAAARSHFVILGGLGGEAIYAKQFAAQVHELESICQKAAGDDARVHVLSGNAATRENVKALMERLRREAEPGDAVILMLIGHGSYDGFNYKFNVPGPDITARQLRELLDAIPPQDQLVVNTTSASGASLDLLKSDRRVVITATKSGRERTATIFAEYWLEALQDPSADTDKNETVTALEAFRYAENKVKEFYESEKRLATEHARLAGDLAGSFVLTRLGSTLEASTDPKARKLLAERDRLEREIGQLRQKKGEMESEEYERELQRLLVELARTQAQIDRAVEKQ